MQLIPFIFSFLYVRNWHTGERELSRPRTALFCGMIFIVALGVGVAFLLQTPITYEAPVLPLE